MNEIFKKRRSVRQFTDEQVTEKQIKAILGAAMVAPSANHVNPWEFIVVKEKSSLKELSEIGMWQKFIEDSSVSIVIVANPNDTDKWVQDCSLAAGHIYLEVANQGLGSCWANVLSDVNRENDREKLVKDVLQIPDEYRVLCVMAIGHPSKEVQPHGEDTYRTDKVHNEVW